MKYTSILFSGLIFFSSILSAEGNWEQYRDRIVELVPTAEGWCPQEKAKRMMDLIHDTQPDLCVEIGVFGGSSFFPTVAALNYENQGIAYGIDPWATAPCLTGMEGENYVWWSKVDLRAVMIRFIDFMHSHRLDHRYSLMRMASDQALEFFADGSIDIIHIDGNHAAEPALFDVKNWLPKVKKGGYIWFDDANWMSTEGAVAYLFQECELAPSSSSKDPYLLFRKVK